MSSKAFVLSSILLLLLIARGTAQCDESKCRDQNYLGGYSCWALVKESTSVSSNQNATNLYICADDLEGRAVFTVPVLSNPEGTFQYYTCCPRGYDGPLVQDCTDTVCNSPGLTSTDCWADGPHEPMTCGSDVYKHPRKTGLTTPFYSWRYSQYICCKTSDGNPRLSRRLVIAESLLLGFASLSFCCGLILIMSIASSKSARSQPFNLYIIFLSIPDTLMNLILMFAAAFPLGGAQFPCSIRNAFLCFNAMSNVLLSIIIYNQIYTLLRKSNRRKRFYPPRMIVVVRQVAGKACL